MSLADELREYARRPTTPPGLVVAARRSRRRTTSHSETTRSILMLLFSTRISKIRRASSRDTRIGSRQLSTRTICTRCRESSAHTMQVR